MGVPREPIRLVGSVARAAARRRAERRRTTPRRCAGYAEARVARARELDLSGLRDEEGLAVLRHGARARLPGRGRRRPGATGSARSRGCSSSGCRCCRSRRRGGSTTRRSARASSSGSSPTPAGRPRSRRACGRGDLVAFHTAHKLALLAHSPAAYRRLGALVGGLAKKGSIARGGRGVRPRASWRRCACPPRAAGTRTSSSTCSATSATCSRAADRKELEEVVHDYARGLVPLVVPQTLFRHHVRRHGVAYLAGQTYLDPDPKELMLRPQPRAGACPSRGSASARSNAAPLRRERAFVLYWMTAARRARFNPALERAVELARELGRPLAILEALRVGYPYASDRLHAFVMQGMAENARAARRARAPPRLRRARAGRGGGGSSRRSPGRACAVVTDDFPTFFVPRMLAAAAERLDVRLEAVDGSCLVPFRLAGKDFSSAYAYRRHLQRLLPDWLDRLPAADPLSRAGLPAPAALPREIAARWPAAESRRARAAGACSSRRSRSITASRPRRAGAARAPPTRGSRAGSRKGSHATPRRVAFPTRRE